MTTASTAFYLLVMLYVVASVLVVYIAIRAYRHLRQHRDQSVALPRPVYETTHTFSFLNLPTNRRKLNAWKLPVPWSRSSSQGQVATTASAKGLSIELLPTTALPPPPTSIPTSPPLVDLSSPSALDPSAAARFSTSLPSSPRRQALSLWPSSPHKGYRYIQHPAFPRPPSPHALLATTPPQRQKRSRSLGGVPVRRLSGGPSGLRNKLDATGTSEEHLLIDFSSSSDDHISVPHHHPPSVSPTASHIGIPPPSALDNKVVDPRPMPLVDITGDVFSSPRKSDPDDTAWVWFDSNAPSTIRSYDARVLAPRPPFLGERKFAFPQPLHFPKTEKLIDIPDVERDSLDSSTTLVEVGDDLLGKEDQPSPVHGGVAIDPFSDDYAVDYIPTLSQTQVDGHHHQSPYPPLIDVDASESQVETDQVPHPPLVEVDGTLETSAEEGLVFGDAQILSGREPVSPALSRPSSSTGPPTLVEQTDWSWAEPDDPWADHVATTQDETLNLDPTYDEVAESHLGPVTQDHPCENAFIGTSPGGSLLATVLAADDEVPHLSLDDPGSAEELQLSHVVLRGQLDDDDEEDATPRPTPISIDIQLPVSDGGSLPSIDNTDHIDILGRTLPIEQTIVNESFSDPDLLPLPEFNPLFSIVEVVRTSPSNDSEDEPIKIEPRPSSQMPTPPASPPSLSPILPNQRKAGKSLPPSPMTGHKNLSVASDVTTSRSRSSSPHVMPITLPADVSKEKHDDLMQDVSVPCPTLHSVEFIEELPSGQTEDDTEETIEPNEIEDHKETSLPGSLPELSSTSTTASSKTTQTVATLLTEKSRPTAPFYPSVRAIVRQPVEIALAMQLRPGLGAGADPAWMVRFLMAMFGWFAVLVSGQENY